MLRGGMDQEDVHPGSGVSTVLQLLKLYRKWGGNRPKREGRYL